MKKIFKYPIQTTDRQVLQMPAGAEILCVQIQNNIPCIWALVDERYSNTERVIFVFGTGNPIEVHPSLKYIGTYQLQGGAFIGHVFEQNN